MASSATSPVDPSDPSTRDPLFKMPTATSAQSAQVLEQPIQLIQSLDLLQTTVCAVVSTVASLRCLFPDDCFRTHQYDIEDPNYSYKDFMDATDEESTTRASKRKKADHRFVPWEILVRGRNHGANKLLDWIELGIADALSHKYLATMQLSVYDGEISVTKRLEAYIMVFSYTDAGAEMTLQLSGGNRLPSPPGKTISSAKEDLRFLVHRLTTHIGGFPKLSPHTIVNMHLTYNDTCPPSYEPPGFVMCQDQALVLQSNEGAPVGSINLGPHSVDLQIFLKESTPKSLTSMATLRGRASAPRPNDYTSPQEIETAVTQDMQSNGESVLPTLHPTQELDQQLSQLSNVTSALDTQERGQLAAIDSMARLRFARHNPHDTQILDVTVSKGDSRHGSVDFDGESTAHDGSSTQGTPSTIGGRRSARLALRSATKSPPRTVSVLRPRKRSPTLDTVEHTPKLRKVSEARSPFTRKRSKR